MGAVREAIDRDREVWKEDNQRRKRSPADEDYCMDRSELHCSVQIWVWFGKFQ